MRNVADLLAGGLRRIMLALVLLIILAPLTLVLVLSFDARDYLGPLPPPGLSLRWYAALLQSDVYIPAFGWSLAVAAVAVSVSTVTGVMAALYLHGRRFAGRDALLALFLSPFLVPNIVAGFALLVAFSHYGIRSAFIRLAAAHTLLTMPFTIRTVLISLDGLRPSFQEAALTLGARPAQVFWEVTFPLVRPGIVAGAVFAASASLGENAASVFLSDQHVTTLPVALLSEMRSNFDLTIAAVSGVIVGLTFVLVVLLDRTVGLERITGRGIYNRL
jgi:putative spermidine/putrescine transport system permease protein